MTESKKERALLEVLTLRFEKYAERHVGLDWGKIVAKLKEQPDKLQVLYRMEESGGEPDVVGYDEETAEYLFFDCAKESPKGRRSACYDLTALESRKKYKPKHNVLDWAKEIGIKLLDEQQYRHLQQLGSFDTKTSSWIKTPENIRDLGGALFGDFRYNHVFIYHNGAESYYAARGFRGVLRL
jgi:hypothetical protein